MSPGGLRSWEVASSPDGRVAVETSLGKDVTAATRSCAASRHGTRAAYVAGCRCAEAREANRRYASWRDRRLLHARHGAAEPLSVPVTDTQDVLTRLFDAGWGMRRIEAETGIGRDHLSRILGRTQRPLHRVRIGTHKTLAALLDREVALADGALIDSAPSLRLIHGLIALGYPKTWIAQQLGLGRALQLHYDRITVRNARKVRDLADRTVVAGPSDAARRYAAAHGWTTDLLLEDAEPVETLGPREDIDPVVIERVCAGDDLPMTIAERFEAYCALRRRGVSGNEIQGRLRLSGGRITEFAARFNASSVGFPVEQEAAG